jgi:hypothetical protein
MQKPIMTLPGDDLKFVVPELPSSLNLPVSQGSHSISSDGAPTTPQTRHSIDDVFAAEKEMLELPQVQLPVVHRFAPGVYARELTIFAGHILTGAVHKTEQLNILSLGRMRLLVDGGFLDVEAPYTVVSPPGTKRIALALTDCVWTTILGTELTDVSEIERTFVCKSREEYLEWLSQSQPLLVSQD